MKRVIRYISFVLVLGVMFSACYYLSYRSALKKLRRMENQQSMNVLFDEQMRLAERMFANLTGSMLADAEAGADTPVQAKTDSDGNSDNLDNPANPVENDISGEDEWAVEANRIEPDRIFSGTKVVSETYDTVTGVFTMQEIMPDSAMIGMTREELVDYLADEFENMPLAEYEKGLLSNELITFSKEKVILRKTYDSGRVDFLYYIAVKNGEIVVYHSDQKTVYEYTGISALGLAEEERLALMEGIRVKTAEELFSLLESYSS